MNKYTVEAWEQEHTYSDGSPIIYATVVKDNYIWVEAELYSFYTGIVELVNSETAPLHNTTQPLHNKIEKLQYTVDMLAKALEESSYAVQRAEYEDEKLAEWSLESVERSEKLEAENERLRQQLNSQAALKVNKGFRKPDGDFLSHIIAHDSIGIQRYVDMQALHNYHIAKKGTDKYELTYEDDTWYICETGDENAWDYKDNIHDAITEVNRLNKLETE